MSRKNRTVTAVSDDRHLHAVADNPGPQDAPTTEDRVHAALAATPGSTTATLALAAGVGRSTAAKILARWGRDGTAIRTAGDGPRSPDTWALATAERDAAAPDTENARSDATATPSAAAPADDPGIAEDAANDVDDATTEDITAVQEATTGSEAEPDGTTTGTTNEVAPCSDANAEADDTAPLPDTAAVDPVDGGTETEPSPAESPATADTTGTAPTDKDRLPKGGLRALVEEYLTDHPGESFGPAKIGKNLSRSGGAVNNALEKLVTAGYAIKTCEAPKRFAINPDKADLPDLAQGADEPALEA